MYILSICCLYLSTATSTSSPSFLYKFINTAFRSHNADGIAILLSFVKRSPECTHKVFCSEENVFYIISK